jgi:hypothetical protein
MADVTSAQWAQPQPVNVVQMNVVGPGPHIQGAKVDISGGQVTVQSFNTGANSVLIESSVSSDAAAICLLAVSGGILLDAALVVCTDSFSATNYENPNRTGGAPTCGNGTLSGGGTVTIDTTLVTTTSVILVSYAIAGARTLPLCVSAVSSGVSFTVIGDDNAAFTWMIMN